MSFIRSREDLERQERAYLAPFAVCSDSVELISATADGMGREHPEPPPTTRTHFQRDWHRITHSRAFRKLEYKTQVIVFGEGGEMGDVIRNRLTHTLEVSQIATAISRALGLNEDLASAVSLAHDLGHTPFGHSGEHALSELVESFSHNDHSLKIVRQLERRYPAFPGLNLSLHTLAGIEKHDLTPAECAQARFLPGAGPSLEAQVASIADQIAYRSHDVEDSLVTGVLSVDDYRESGLELWGGIWDAHSSAIPPMETRLAQLTSRLINRMVIDVLHETSRRLEVAGVRSVDDVYAAEAPLVGFSDGFAPHNDALGVFLLERFYMNYRVLRGTTKGQMILRRLFAHFSNYPALLPPEVQTDWRAADAAGADALGRDPQRIIADYIAGMTDREAYSLYVKLFEVGHA